MEVLSDMEITPLDFCSNGRGGSIEDWSPNAFWKYEKRCYVKLKISP